jgi:hypothetical protein
MNGMQKVIIIFALIFAVFSNVIVAQEKPKRIAILELEAKNAQKPYAEIIRDIMEVKLQKSRLFDVLERNQIKMILNEQKFQMTDCSDSICAVQIGKILYADLVIVGSLSKIAKYTLSLKIVDVKNGLIMLADSESAETDAELDKAANNIVDRIVRDIQSNNYGAKAYVFEDSKKQSGKPMYFGVYYRYGVIPNMEIPSIHVPANYPDPITMSTKKRDNTIMEVMIAPIIELNSYIKLRPGFNGSSGIKRGIAQLDNTTIHGIPSGSNTILIDLKNNNSNYYSIGTGIAVLFEYTFYRLVPYIGIGMGYSRYGNTGNYPFTVRRPVEGYQDTYNIAIDKQINIIYTEVEIGFTAFLSEVIGFSFTGIYNYTVYGNLSHKFRVKKTEGNGNGIPTVYQDLDKKLNMSKFDEKRLTPIWYLQFGVIYRL